MKRRTFGRFVAEIDHCEDRTGYDCWILFTGRDQVVAQASLACAMDTGTLEFPNGETKKITEHQVDAIWQWAVSNGY